MKIPSQSTGITSDRALWQDQLSGGNQALRKAGLQEIPDQIRDRIPDVTLKSHRSREGLAGTMELFGNMFETELEQSSAYAHDSEMLNAVKANTRDLFAGLAAKTFKVLDDRIAKGADDIEVRHFLKQANNRATKLLNEFKAVAQDAAIHDMRTDLQNARGAAAARGTPPPQLLVKDDGTFSLIRARPAIENLVLGGGGGKGVGMPPALTEMIDTGYLDGLQKVVGTSVGALNAVSVAIGQPSDRLTAMSDSFDKTWLGHDKALAKNYPEMSCNWHAYLCNAVRVVAELDGAIQNEIKLTDFSQVQLPDDLGKVNEIAKALGMEPSEATEKAEIDAFRDRVFAGAGDRIDVLENSLLGGDRSGKMVTFNDMKMLHLLMPEKFRELELTAFDTAQKTETLFKADGPFGTMPIAFAARASMAHPAIAQSVKFPQWAGGTTFTDGGIKSNLATEAAYGGVAHMGDATSEKTGQAELQEISVRTALMVFDEQGEAYGNLHAPATERQEESHGFIGLVTGNRNIQGDWQADRDKTYAGAANSMVVFHGDLGTMDTGPSSERKEAAIRQSTLKTLEQLVNLSDMQGDAYVVDAGDLEQALSLLSDNELAALKSNPPDRDNFAAGPSGDAAFQATQDLYQLAMT